MFLGAKVMEKDGKVTLKGVPLRTVSKYKKLMVEWGWSRVMLECEI